MVGDGDIKMENVRPLTKDGRPARPLRTVIAAIDYIDEVLEEQLRQRPAFSKAKNSLHLALERKMPVEIARGAFLTALKESGRLWT